MVVIQEAYGVNDHIHDVCQRFAAAGYVAIAPEIFHRTGAGIVAGYDDFTKIKPAFMALTNTGLAMDITATLAALRSRPDVDGAHVGIVGFCVGGFAAFLAACETDVAASVCFYPGGLVHPRPGIGLAPPLNHAGHIQRPVLLFFGDADHGIPAAEVDAVRARLADENKTHEIHVYPGAGHGFFCNDRPAYHAEAAKQAWARMLPWLEENL